MTHYNELKMKMNRYGKKREVNETIIHYRHLFYLISPRL